MSNERDYSRSRSKRGPGARRSPIGALIVAISVCPMAACLPDGNAPTGQHLIHDRTITEAQFAGDSLGGAQRFLVQGPPIHPPAQSSTPVSIGYDMYLATTPAPGLPPLSGLAAGSTLVVQRAHPHRFCSLPICFGGRPTDSRGRILIASGYDPVWNTNSQLRLDAASGELADLGPGAEAQLSPDGSLLKLTVPRPTGSVLVIHHVDGAMVEVDGSLGYFLGNELYFVTSTRVLQRLGADLAPQTVATEVDSLSIHGAAGETAIMLICRRSPAPATGMPSQPGCQYTAFDPTTSREMPLSVEGLSNVTVSPDGRKVLVSTNQPSFDAPTRLIVVDLATGEHESVEVKGSISATWRPGHEEVWVTVYATGPERGPRTMIWRLGGRGLDELPTDVFPYQRMPAGESSLFGGDGRHIFVLANADFTDPNVWNRGQAEVRLADQPLEKGFPVNPPGTGPGRLWVAGRRLLIEAYITDTNRNDISILDPDTGVSRPLATGGHLLLVGETRALAMLRWAATKNTGDLTLIDLDTGTRTVLAENVYGLALEPPTPGPGAPANDPLASGRRLAYLVRNSFASPHDGLWTVVLP